MPQAARQLEAHADDPITPLSDLENRENDLRSNEAADPSGGSGQLYSDTQRPQWLGNVNNFFRKLARFLGKCK